MSKKNRRKGDTFLTFGIAGIIIGIFFMRAPIGLPALLVGAICLAAWFFMRAQDNGDRRHQETVETLRAQLEEERRRNNS